MVALGGGTHIHVEGELAILEGEHLVDALGLVVQVGARAHIGAGGLSALGHKLEGQGIVLGRDAVRRLELRDGASVESAILCAGLAVWAEGRVPGVAVVAVGIRALQPWGQGRTGRGRVRGRCISPVCGSSPSWSRWRLLPAERCSPQLWCTHARIFEGGHSSSGHQTAEQSRLRR